MHVKNQFLLNGNQKGGVLLPVSMIAILLSIFTVVIFSEIKNSSDFVSSLSLKEDVDVSTEKVKMLLGFTDICAKNLQPYITTTAWKSKGVKLQQIYTLAKGRKLSRTKAFSINSNTNPRYKATSLLITDFKRVCSIGNHYKAKVVLNFRSNSFRIGGRDVQREFPLFISLNDTENEIDYCSAASEIFRSEDGTGCGVM